MDETVDSVEFPPLRAVIGRNDHGSHVFGEEIREAAFRRGLFPVACIDLARRGLSEAPGKVEYGFHPGTSSATAAQFFLSGRPDFRSVDGLFRFAKRIRENLHFKEISHAETLVASHELDRYPGFFQKRRDRLHLAVRVREHRDRSPSLFRRQGFHDGRLQIFRRMVNDPHLARAFANRSVFARFETVLETARVAVCRMHDRGETAPIVDKLVPLGVEGGVRLERREVCGVGTAESVDVLVVISDRQHPHFGIALNQGLYEREFVRVHVLRFIEDERRRRHRRRFHPPLPDRLDRTGHRVRRRFDRTGTSKELEGVGVKGLHRDEARARPVEFDQPGLEFQGGRARESEHHKLLGPDVFGEHQVGELVHQYSRFAASRPRRHDDVLCLREENFLLRVGERADELFVERGRHAAFQFLFPSAPEVGFEEVRIGKLKVVPNVALRRLAVADHEVRVFAHDVNLLDALLVVVVEEGVVLLPVLSAVVGDEPLEPHRKVGDEEAPVDRHESVSMQKEERLLEFVRRGLLAKKARGIVDVP